MSSWETQFSFTIPLSTQMYKWEPVIIILGRRAITSLMSGRYETLGLHGDDFTISPTASILVVPRIIASIAGVPKKFTFISTPRKLKYCISPVIKAVKENPLLPCPIFGIQYTDLVCLPPWKCVDEESNEGIEKGKVSSKTFSSNFVGHSATWLGKRTILDI